MLEASPDEASAYYHLGLAVRDRDRISEAITNFKKALNLYQQQNKLETVKKIKTILQNLGNPINDI